MTLAALAAVVPFLIAPGVFPCQDGDSVPAYHTTVWTNPVGAPTAIVSLHTWIGADAGRRYDVGLSVTRLSDGAVLLVNNWDRYGESTSLSDREYSFAPGGVALTPDDALAVTSWCISYDGPGAAAAITVTPRLVR